MTRSEGTSASSDCPQVHTAAYGPLSPSVHGITPFAPLSRPQTVLGKQEVCLLPLRQPPAPSRPRVSPGVWWLEGPRIDRVLQSLFHCVRRVWLCVVCSGLLPAAAHVGILLLSKESSWPPSGWSSRRVSAHRWQTLGSLPPLAVVSDAAGSAGARAPV